MTKAFTVSARDSARVLSPPRPSTSLPVAATDKIEPVPIGNGGPLPEGTYIWTIDDATESGPLDTHAGRTYVPPIASAAGRFGFGMNRTTRLGTVAISAHPSPTERKSSTDGSALYAFLTW